MTDRSRDVSDALTEVRTVLRRAESAMDRLIYLSYRGNQGTLRHTGRSYNDPLPQWEYDGPPTGEEPDPDTEDMYLALERVIHELDRWRRAGKRKKR